MTFKQPLFLVILPLFLLFAFAMIKNRKSAGFIFPTSDVVKSFTGGLKARLAPKMIYLRAISIILIILALARPQIMEEEQIRKEGIAIMMAIDTSSTMLADDIHLSLEELAGRKNLKGRNLTRIDAVKEVAAEFIASRGDDLMGIIAFAAEAFVVCPPTFDHEWLLESLEMIKVGLIKDGTAIGSGILASVNALKDVESKSKVIILLTDGINNFGKVPAPVAAKAARALGIKIYTIGVAGESSFRAAADGSGRKEYRQVGVSLDEDELKKIASSTGGEYYRVKNMSTLKESYKEIDKLERTGITEKGYESYQDMFNIFLIPGLILLLLELILSGTFLRRIP